MLQHWHEQLTPAYFTWPKFDWHFVPAAYRTPFAQQGQTVLVRSTKKPFAFCLSAPAGPPPAVATIKRCINTPDQMFTHDAQGRLMISYGEDNAYQACLTVTDAGTAEGTTVVLQECMPAASVGRHQRWSQNLYGQLLPEHAFGMCATLNATRPSNPLTLTADCSPITGVGTSWVAGEHGIWVYAKRIYCFPLLPCNIYI